MTTLVIPTHNQPEKLRRCLESIRDHTDDFRILVIENDADPESVRIAHQLADRVVSMPGKIPEQRSLYELWNEGVRLSNTLYLGFLNDDLVVTPGWLSALRAVLDANPQVWCVSPRYSSGQLPSRFPEHDGLQSPRPLGFCFVARRNVFRNPAVGLFDTTYGIWGGDSEFFLKLRLAGHPTVVVPESYIHHWGSSTLKTLDTKHATSPDTKLYGERWKDAVSPYQP